MSQRPDITVYDDEGNLALVVEVKNKTGTNSEWAAKMRQNLLASSFITDAEYFLLTLPDRFYLWKGKKLPELEEPLYETDASPILRPYFDRAGVSPENLSGTGFELLIVSWLNDLISTGEIPGVSHNNDWIIQSGLSSALKRGRVIFEVVA